MNTQQPPRRKKFGKILMVSAGILLVSDLVIWTVTLSSPLLGSRGEPVAIVAGYLVFLLGLPLLFIGPLFFFIGLMLTYAVKQRSGVIVTLSGLITLVIGILAFVIPQLLVEPGSGDTTMAWMAGLTALFTGIPLIITGGVLLIVGLVLVLKQFVSTPARNIRETI